MKIYGQHIMLNNPMIREALNNIDSKLYYILKRLYYPNMTLSFNDTQTIFESNWLEDYNVISLLNSKNIYEKVQEAYSSKTLNKDFLDNIDPSLADEIENLYNAKSDCIRYFNFEAHDASNFDCDRFDYLSRENLNNPLPPEIPSYTKINGKDVYSSKFLPAIFNTLLIRREQYENLYFHPLTTISEIALKPFFEMLEKDNPKQGIISEFKNFLEQLSTCNGDINKIDLETFMKWDDIKAYSAIFYIIENHPNKQIRDMACIIFPNIINFLTSLHNIIHNNIPSVDSSSTTKDFLDRLHKKFYNKQRISDFQSQIDTIKDNSVYFIEDREIPDDLKQYVFTFSANIKAYNPADPIYIYDDDDDEIYELTNYPKLDSNALKDFLAPKTICYNFVYLPYIYYMEPDKANQIIEQLKQLNTEIHIPDVLQSVIDQNKNIQNILLESLNLPDLSEPNER